MYYLGYLLADDLASIMLNWISIFLFNIYQHKQKHMNGKTLFKTKTCFAFGVRLGEARGFMEQWFSYITTSNTYIFGTIDWSCRSQLSISDQYWIGRFKVVSCIKYFCKICAYIVCLKKPPKNRATIRKFCKMHVFELVYLLIVICTPYFKSIPMYLKFSIVPCWISNRIEQ